MNAREALDVVKGFLLLDHVDMGKLLVALPVLSRAVERDEARAALSGRTVSCENCNAMAVERDRALEQTARDTAKINEIVDSASKERYALRARLAAVRVFEMTPRQVVILRDVLQAYQPRLDDEPIAEQEALRMWFEKKAGPVARATLAAGELHLRTVVDDRVPKGEIHFVDRDGKCVGKIVDAAGEESDGN